MPYTYEWLKLGYKSLEYFLQDLTEYQFDKVGQRITLKMDPNLSPANKLSQLNVLQQSQHLLTYDVVREAVAKVRINSTNFVFNLIESEKIATIRKRI